MPKSDRIRLQHMLDSARVVAGSVRNRVRADLDLDHVWAMGIVKYMEVIGEAAVRVTDETKAALPEIPWFVLAGIRNRLVHAYFEIDFDQIWKAATDDIPVLITQLESAIDNLPPPPSSD
jgi:uncharacterized protein with HEPN domain